MGRYRGRSSHSQFEEYRDCGTDPRLLAPEKQGVAKDKKTKLRRAYCNIAAGVSGGRLRRFHRVGFYRDRIKGRMAVRLFSSLKKRTTQIGGMSQNWVKKGRRIVQNKIEIGSRIVEEKANFPAIYFFSQTIEIPNACSVDPISYHSIVARFFPAKP